MYLIPLLQPTPVYQNLIEDNLLPNVVTINTIQKVQIQYLLIYSNEKFRQNDRAVMYF